jgi:hypothetical protein
MADLQLERHVADELDPGASLDRRTSIVSEVREIARERDGGADPRERVRPRPWRCGRLGRILRGREERERGGRGERDASRRCRLRTRTRPLP